MVFETPHQDTDICVGQFETDFFVLAGGVAGKHPGAAAKLAVDTAVWGYKTIRTRKYYWLDKKKLMQRIMRSTNIALWQKQKEYHMTDGVWADCICCIKGKDQVWVGCMGITSVVEQRITGERRIMGWTTETYHKQQTSLGSVRYDIKLSIGTFPYSVGDIFLFAVGDTAMQDTKTLDEYITMWKTIPHADMTLPKSQVAFLDVVL